MAAIRTMQDEPIYDEIDTDSGQGLSEIFGAIRRRRNVLFIVVGVSLLIAFGITSVLTPRYSADARVLLESQSRNLVSVGAGATMLPIDPTLVRSEAIVLTSRALAVRVIEKANLLEDPEFNPERVAPASQQSGSALPGLLDSVADVASSVVESVSGLFDGSSDRPAANRNDLTSSLVVDSFLQRLRVAPLAESRAISVSFSSEDPVKAAQIVNMVVDEYIASQVDAKLDSTLRATGWIDEQIDELQSQVAENEATVERARQEYGLQQTGGITLTSRELANLDAELVDARLERTELGARLRQVESLISSSADMDAITEVVTSELIQNLRQQQADLAREAAELATEYGERHPRMVQLRAEEVDLQSHIDGEIENIISSIRNQMAVAEVRVETLEIELEELKTRVGEADQNAIHVRALEREADSSRVLLATLLTRQKEILAQQDEIFQEADARIISRAEIPLTKSFPLTSLILGLVTLASGLFGFMLIMILELVDRGFHSGEQLEQGTGLPSLGIVPRVSGRGESPIETVLKNARSAYSESIRTLNWSISLSQRDDDPPQVVLITSANSGEGKSTVATSLALSQAASGQKVLLIDADSRWPSVQELTGLSSPIGLTDVLRRKANLKKAIVTHEETKLDVLLAGAPVTNPSTLLSSERMRDVLQELRGRYDLIIFDSPPIIACSDSLVLTRLVDTTVMIVRFAKTRQEVAKLCVRKLKIARARLAGVLLTNVNLKKYSTYYYGDSGAYSGDLAKYYSG